MKDSAACPIAWRGDELFDRSDWRLCLSQADLNEIRETLLMTRGLREDDLDASTFALPGLGKKLQQIQDSLEHGSGATMIKGYPATEYSAIDNRRVFIGLSVHLGTPVSQSASGERVFSVRDGGYHQDDPRARGPNTRKNLSFHTDRCDVIGFMCLQQALEGGENEVVSSMALYHEIARRRPDLLEILKQPFWSKRHTVDKGNELAFCRQPVFSFTQGHFACSFLRVLIDQAYADPARMDMSAIEKEALDFLEEVAAEPGMPVKFRQEPGDILFLNNWVTLHRRTAFQDADEPDQRRHILRTWLSVPNSRPIDPLFKDNYGATESGDLRGGMRQQGDLPSTTGIVEIISP